ncbi:competence protein ComEA [Alkalibaculum bacchi]|uniref:Competence protein ComEA n=1 Tax=Alkalibaculum bacchi TaxID=645887 RepID=A0A366I662_9FIRM|nr:helix-hairpin-helix domain-containing protein [Alkalibaculum bacchi]RBP63896.1 competence protein ComEA [Alkalibaculum bacchi]
MDRVKLKEWIRNNKLTIIVVILFVVSLLIYYSSIFKNSSIENSKMDVLEKEVEKSEEPTEETAKTIIVHISGEVIKPGIIELDYGQRLYEAIEMAGGPTEKADVEQVNLAMILEDQQKVVIPSTDNGAQGNPTIEYSAGGGAAVKININTADKTQLMELPRIGDATAEAIIQYREENQGFKKIEDIKNVPRIGDVTFEGFKDKITCY